jgi:hypothetical protein
MVSNKAESSLSIKILYVFTIECGIEKKIKNNKKMSRDSSVGIATGYGLDNQGGREFESR